MSLLVRSVEGATDAMLQAMTKIHWNAIEEVGDSSPYVAEVGKIVHHSADDTDVEGIPSVRACHSVWTVHKSKVLYAVLHEPC